MTRWGRNFTGRGQHAPRIDGPGGALRAVNLVVVCEEGSEYPLLEGHGRNAGWGEYACIVGPRMMTVAVRARWTGQPNRASALRRILEHGLAQPGVAFLRRDDMARHVLANHSGLPDILPQL